MSRRLLGVLVSTVAIFVACRAARATTRTAITARSPSGPVVAPVSSLREPPLSRSRLALPVLLAAAIALSLGGYAVWPGFGFLDRSRAPEGGVLLLHDLLPFNDSPDEILGTRAEVGVQIWSTGFPGVSIAELEVRFEKPRPDDHWYVIASGDWAVTPDRDADLYCKYGEGRVVDAGIECEAQVGNPEMQFRFDQELGNFTGNGLVSDSIVDFDGYDRDHVTVVSGSMPLTNEYGENVLEARLPIATPPIQSVGGEDFFAYPPIASLDNEWGSGPPLAESCDMTGTEGWALFVLTQSCAPVTYVGVTSTTLDPGIEVGSRTVEYAAPDTISDDELRWSVEGGLAGAQALIRDPFAQADESRRAFVAALILSVGISFALLFFERLLFHRSAGAPGTRSRRRL